MCIETDTPSASSVKKKNVRATAGFHVRCISLRHLDHKPAFISGCLWVCVCVSVCWCVCVSTHSVFSCGPGTPRLLFFRVVFVCVCVCQCVCVCVSVCVRERGGGGN